MKRILAAFASFAVVATVAYATSYTTYYELGKPEDGDDSYGETIRDNMDRIDEQMHANAGANASHLADTVGAHAASAISATPGADTCTSSDTVQEFLTCLDAVFTDASGVVMKTGDQTIDGTKTFLDTPIFDDEGLGVLVSDANGVIDSDSTPALGTPSAAVLTNATGLPIATGVSGLGTGVATVLATPSSANLATAVTDETGTGELVFAQTPTLFAPDLGTPSAVTLTNALGLPISSGVSGLGSGVATFLGTPSSANLAAAVTGETGTGALVFGTAPQFMTNLDLLAAGETRYYNAGGTFYTGFKGGNAGANKIWTLPTADGNPEQVLKTDGSGVLGWVTPSVTSAIDLTDLSVADTTTPANSLHIKSDSGLSADRNFYVYRDDTATDRWLSLDGGDFGVSGGNIYLSTGPAGSSITLPDSGTLVTTTGSQTLDGKTLNDPILTHTTVLRNGAGLGNTQPKMSFSEDPDNGTDTTSIQATASLAASYTLTLPVDDGNSGEVLSTNGSGVLSWSAAGAGFANPMDSAGDMIYGGALGVATKLDSGSSGQFLASGGAGAPVWTTLVPLANGGTNKATTAANGGIVWTDADSYEVTAAGTAQQWVLSGGAGTPTMSNTTTTGKTIDGTADEIQLTVQGHSTQTNQIALVENSAGVDLFAVTNGVTSTQPTIQLYEAPDNGTNKLIIQAGANMTADRTFTFPTTTGASGTYIRTTGSGTTTWASLQVGDLASAVTLAKGGTEKALTAANGGLVWSDADSLEITAAGTASDWVLSGGAGTPTMSSTTTTAKMIDGSVAGDVQFTVQGASSQSNSIFVVENSAAGDIFTIASTGEATLSTALQVATATNNPTIIQQQESTLNNTDEALRVQFSGNATATGAYFIKFMDTAEIGSVTSASATAVSFNTTSDARLKENVEPYPHGLDDVMAMKPRKFNWIEDGHEDRGFIAQEMKKVFPWNGAVTGDPKESEKVHPMQMDYGRITPAIVAAIQELKHENDKLRARLDVLEAVNQ